MYKIELILKDTVEKNNIYIFLGGAAYFISTLFYKLQYDGYMLAVSTPNVYLFVVLNTFVL